eukprot:maker-scaffold714_size108203-snap-gene-0.17 protein:Tk02389 transcript:maker-scaffold714_size108203-snap-gene-0.17-mRNA-1 annotation:"PREDICTED: uncharacterized protein LOC101285465"
MASTPSSAASSLARRYFSQDERKYCFAPSKASSIPLGQTLADPWVLWFFSLTLSEVMGTTSEGWNALALEGILAEAQTLRSLVGVSIEDWVVLQKSTFDIRANNEPHIAHTLYMEKATGRYLHKVFGKTIQDGQLDTPLGLRDLAQDIFEHSRVCQGFQDDVKVKPGITLAPGFHPYDRQVVPNCLKLFKDPSGRAALCPNCIQATHFDVDPLAEETSSCEDNPTTPKDSKEKDRAPINFPDIDIDENKTFLWSDGKLIKEEIKDDESNSNNSDSADEEEQNGEMAELLSASKKTKFTEVLDSNTELANPKNNAKGEEGIRLTRGVKKAHCDHCNKTFANDQNYRSHRAFLRRPERIITCQECNKAHYSFASLAEHMKKEHTKTAIAFGKFIQTPQRIKTMKKAQKCSTCYSYFNGHVLLRRHRTLYHELGNYECTDCNQHFLTYYHQVLHNHNQHSRISPYFEPTTEALDLVKHKDGTEEFVRNGHVCPKCEKLFKRDGEWGIHMKIHHAWSIFICEPCDEMCHYASDFLAHVKNFHSNKPEIKCPICSDVFCVKDGSDVFMTHFKTCAKKLLPKFKAKPGQCDKCGRNFSTNYLLQAHLKSHAGDEKYLCDTCDYGTNLKSVMQDHQKSHLREQGMTHDADGNNLFKYCDQCPKKFVFQGALNRHIKHIHQDRSYRNHRAFLRRPERNILCKDCDKAHYSFASLAEHIEKDHEKAAIEFGKYIQTPQDMKTMKKAQKCSACYGYFNGHVLLRRHRTLYHELGGYECTDCNQHFLTYYHQVLHNYNQHSRISPYLEPTTEALDLVKHKDGTEEFVRNGHVCPKCEKLFKRDGEWGKHMKAYHAWSIFFCEPCDEMCHYATDFLAHVKNFHSDKPEIKCPICSDVFCLKEGSEKFMTHFNACAMNLLKRNPGQCEKCGKNFSNDYLLQAHLKSHDGEEKYLCDKCDYGTNLKAVMQDHQRSHLREQGMTHDGDGNDLFKYCAQCPKKFVFQTALNRHIKHIHEGIQRQGAMGARSESWNTLALEGFLAEAQTLRSLVGVSIEDWVVLQKSTFDIRDNNEPHIAQTLYMEKATGRYLHKIFGRTIQDGRLDAPSGLKDLAQDIFEHSRVCQGFRADIKVEPGITLTPGLHPYPRQIDPKCQLVFKDPNGQAIVCPNCTRALNPDLADPLSQGQISGLLENPRPVDVKNENDLALDDVHDFAMYEPETALWVDHSPSKHMITEHRQMPIALREYLQTPEQIDIMKRAQKCSTCDIHFNGIVMLNRHRALVHELGDFKCSYCKQYHLTYYHLVLHNYNKHSRRTPYLHPSTKDLDVVNYKDGTIELRRNQRSSIKTYALAGKSATETHKLLIEAYGGKALGRSQTFQLPKEVREGRQYVQDQRGRPGQQRTVRTPENVAIAKLSEPVVIPRVAVPAAHEKAILVHGVDLEMKNGKMHFVLFPLQLRTTHQG